MQRIFTASERSGAKQSDASRRRGRRTPMPKPRAHEEPHGCPCVGASSSSASLPPETIRRLLPRREGVAMSVKVRSLPLLLTPIVCVVLLGATPRETSGVVSTPPQMILNETTSALPKTPTASVRVFVGTLSPGDVTFWHIHASPPIVYVESGAATWEFKGGRRAETRHVGQAMLEPANVAVRLVNRGATTVHVVMVSASAPGVPFMRPAP